MAGLALAAGALRRVELMVELHPTGRRGQDVGVLRLLLLGFHWLNEGGTMEANVPPFYQLPTRIPPFCSAHVFGHLAEF